MSVSIKTRQGQFLNIEHIEHHSTRQLLQHLHGRIQAEAGPRGSFRRCSPRALVIPKSCNLCGQCWGSYQNVCRAVPTVSTEHVEINRNKRTRRESAAVCSTSSGEQTNITYENPRNPWTFGEENETVPFGLFATCEGLGAASNGRTISVPMFTDLGVTNWLNSIGLQPIRKCWYILISCNNIQLQSCKNNNHCHRSSTHQKGKRTLRTRQINDIDVTNMTDQKLCAPSMPWPWLFQYPSTWMMRHVSEHRHVWHVYISLVFRLRIFGRSTGRENSDIVGECARWAFRDIEWFLMFLLFERYIQIGAAHGRPVYRQQGSTTVIRYWSRTWSEQNRASCWRAVASCDQNRNVLNPGHHKSVGLSIEKVSESLTCFT